MMSCGEAAASLPAPVGLRTVELSLALALAIRCDCCFGTPHISRGNVYSCAFVQHVVHVQAGQPWRGQLCASTAWQVWRRTAAAGRRAPRRRLAALPFREPRLRLRPRSPACRAARLRSQHITRQLGHTAQCDACHPALRSAPPK